MQRMRYTVVFGLVGAILAAYLIPLSPRIIHIPVVNCFVPPGAGLSYIVPLGREQLQTLCPPVILNMALHASIGLAVGAFVGRMIDRSRGQNSEG